MNEQVQDQPVLDHIETLVAEEHRLYEHGEHGTLEEADRQRLSQVQVELDQCWDLLRQRRALRETGQDPDKARLRPPQTVEEYEQ
jgi:hypothetical protein